MSKTVHIDATAMLAKGQDPLGEVLRQAEMLPPGGELVVEAPFDPVPLRQILAHRGFIAQVSPGAAGVRAAFRRESGAVAAPEDPDLPQCPATPQWSDADGSLHLDLRGLTPPLPMVIILRLLVSGPGSAVVAHLDREPVYLYPELAEIGWQAAVIDRDGDHLQVRLSREDG